MIEILAIAWLSGKVAQIVENKGYQGGKYRWMAVGLWLGGELVGAIVGSIIGLIFTNGGFGAQCITYVVAIIGAIIGAKIALNTVNTLEPVQESSIISNMSDKPLS